MSDTIFISSKLEQSEFMQSYLIVLRRDRCLNFMFLYEAFRRLVKEDSRVETSVGELFGDPPPTIEREQEILMEHVGRVVSLCKTRDNPCKRQTMRTIRALNSEHPFPLILIEECIEFHFKHLRQNDPGSYFQFFGCIGLLCTEAVAWGMHRHFLFIIKEAEERINKYRNSFPGYEKLWMYAENNFENS